MRVLRRINIKYVIPTLLSFALVGALVWLVYAPDFEPVVTSLALLASLLSIYFDRFFAEKERKKEALTALANELYMNIGVIEGLKGASSEEKVNRPHVYPRFYTSSLSRAISSGVFTGKEDKKLWKLMNSWLQYSVDYNNRLSVTEMHAFSNPSKAADFNKKLITSKSAEIAIGGFHKLQELVFGQYSTLTGIDNDTILFDSE